jgi:CheY-like chemotaxis protein
MVHNLNGVVRILYVEDEKSIREVVAQMLELYGYEVACANNGKLGVEKAQSWLPDIILMDVRMPVMDGPEAIRVLRSKPNTADIPIFVLSAYTDTKTRDLCKQVGADRFFAKPFDIEKIISAIQETMNPKKSLDSRKD